MAGIRSLKQGIELIRQGSPNEGARMIRNALKDPMLPDKTRAIAHVWLSVAVPERAQKIEFLEKAIGFDPLNHNAQKLWADMMSDGLDDMITGAHKAIADPVSPPPNVPSVMPPSKFETEVAPQALMDQRRNGTRQISLGQVRNPLDTETTTQVAPPVTVPTQPLFYNIVTLLDGPNGPSSGFFITLDGLLVTSRYAVGTREVVTIALDPTRSASGRVVRSFPHLDMAFVAVDINLQTLLRFGAFVRIPENINLQVVNINNLVRQGRSYESRRKLQDGWFSTTIRDAQDAHGSPIKDERGMVIGMLTSASNAVTGEFYGVSIGVIREKAEEYLSTLRIDQHYTYCTCCGNLSRAEVVGAYYCEYCGTVMPNAAPYNRSYSPMFDALYHEHEGLMCKHCASRIGRWEGRCLRCGRET